MKYDINKLTASEREKLANIMKMYAAGVPTIEPEVSDLEEQIDFIRRYGSRKSAFYSDKWYHENTKRTKAMYFKVRNNYVKNKRISIKKYENAKESLKKLLVKMQVEELQEV